MEKYNNFADLYKDYKELIDSEYALRNEQLLDYLLDNVKKEEIKTSSHISGFNSHLDNQYWREEVNRWKEIRKKVETLIHSYPRHRLDCDHITEITQKFKNRIIDTIYTIEAERHRPSERLKYYKRASVIADIFENAINAAYLKSGCYTIENIDKVYTEELCKRIDIEVETMNQENYHNGGSMLEAYLKLKINGEDEKAEALKKANEQYNSHN